MHKRVVLLFGPPGAGKGTQAELLEGLFNFVHFDTGKWIERLVRTKGADRDPIIRHEKELFDTGKLCTPSWVLSVITEATTRIANAGLSIVFSGSPRTMYEALGEKGYAGLFDTLESLYGKKNVSALLLSIKPGTSLKRNGARRVCSVCGVPILAHAKNARCAFCDGPTRRRTLDKPEVIKVRLVEYRTRTLPIFREMKKRGYVIKRVNAEPLPYKVFESVKRAIGDL